MPPRSHAFACASLAFVTVAGWLAFAPPPEVSEVGNVPGAGLTPVTGAPAARLPGPWAAGADLLPATAPLDAKPAPQAPVPPDFPDRIVSADGKSVAITLPDGDRVEGEVASLKRDDKGVLVVEGRVTRPEPGRFFFQRQTIPGKAGPLVGFIHFEKSTTAWQVRPEGKDVSPVLVKTTVDRVMCRAMAPRPPEAIPQTHPDDDPIPPDENGIIQLQSLPGATSVIYLDFDGDEAVFPLWGYINAAPADATNSQIHEVWRGVAEDYLPFNINVTTVRSVYQNAPDGHRIRVMVTPTDDALPGAGGVAYTGSFNWSGNIVCWSFSTTGKNAVEVISHEVGHTLGLSHDGRTSPADLYYAGHSGWAPIMGASYYQIPSQWSKGEYAGANNTEDDLQIIATTNNGVDYSTDDHGDTTAAAGWLHIAPGGTVANEGVIGSTPDADVFRFRTSGGNLDFTIENATFNPNLDLKAEILDASEAVVGSSDPAGSLDASFSALHLAAGDYFLRVSGTGKGNPLTTGYSDYGSLGAYTITGTISGGDPADRFTIAEHSPAATVVGTSLPRADHGAGTTAFAIVSGNTGGTFAINPATGVITVANGTLLDFEALSSRWDDPAEFELFIEITDSLGVVAETIRTVVEVTDLNEAPDFPPPDSITIPEQMIAGTAVARMTATDPDRGDHLVWSIVSGNTGGAFAIDPDTGVITTAGPLDFESLAGYVLTLRATDHGSPVLSADETLTISLLDIAEHLAPGAVSRTVFRDIDGAAITSLTSNPRFPAHPHSEGLLPSFSTTTTDGSSYGSTLRALLIAPVTGTYTFWIAGDDAAELRLSTDDTPANAAVAASAATRTDPFDWTNQPSQQSAGVFLTAGQSYYIEARHKQDDEAAHLSVAWELPGSSGPEVIPGRWLSAWQEDYAPWAGDRVSIARVHARNGQGVDSFSFVEPDVGQQVAVHAITAGNEDGAFAIDPLTGSVTIANSSALVVGATRTLTVSATDDGVPATAGSATLTVEILDLDAGLHLWWPLDETAGSTAMDVSGGSRHGYLGGGAAWIPRAPANGALDLNGTSAFVETGAGHGLGGTTSFTVAAWVKVPPAHSADAVLFQQRGVGPGGDIGSFQVTVTAGGNIRFNLNGRDAGGASGTQFDLTSSAAVSDGNWHHIACVRDGAAGRIFIDGVLAGSAGGTPRALDPDFVIAAGYDAGTGSSFLPAVIDDVRIHPDALGEDQLLRIAGAPKLKITSPSASTVDLPSGVGLLIDAVASDPDGPVPAITWSQVSGPSSAVFAPPGPSSAAVTFADPGTYVFRASVNDGGQETRDEVTVNVGVSASSGLAMHEYGINSIGGFYQIGPGSFVIEGLSSGIEPAAASDGFQLLGQSFTGDFDIRTRVTGLEDVPDTSTERAGLALRVGTAGNDDEVGGFIGFGGNGSGFWIRRASTGGGNIAVEYPAMPVPAWCRIERSGGVIRYYHSTDGETWLERGLVLNFSEVRVGLCWASGSAVESGAASFEQVSGFSVDNLAPYVEATSGGFAYVNFPADLNGLASDDGRPSAVAPTVEWRLADGPGPVTFADATQSITTVNCSAPGLHTFRLIADDGAVRTFAETSLAAETFDIVGVVASDSNAAETGPDTGTFTFIREGSMAGDLTVPVVITGSAENGTDYSALPSSVVIPHGVAQVTLTLTPLADTVVEGDETVMLSIGPGTYSISDDNALITIEDSNHEPQWTSTTLGRPDADETQAYAAAGLDADSWDPDGDAITFTKTAGPAWLEVAPNGALSGTPLPADAGSNSFTVRATDSRGVYSEATLTILVRFANDPPVFVISPLAGPDAMAGLSYAAALPPACADDPDLPQGDLLVFSKTAGPAWLEIAPDGTLGGVAPTVPGMQEFTVRVTDSGGLFAETVLNLNVIPATLYLDANGADPGSGAPASIMWDNAAAWTPSPAGEAATVPWIDGSVAVFSAGSDAASTVVTVDGTKSITGLTLEEGTLVLTGGTLLPGGTAVPFHITGTATVSSEIAGGGLLKSGSGRLILEGTHSPAALDIAQGTFTLRGSLPTVAGIPVAAGATLDGGGSTTAAVSISGTLSAGEGAGLLTVGALALLADSTLRWDCADWTGTAGTGFDTIDATTLDLSGASPLRIEPTATSLSHFAETPRSFPLIRTTGGITGFNPANVIIDDTAFPGTAGTWSVRVDGSDLVLDYTPPPPFELWQIEEFAGDAGNPLIAGAAADPDHDGMENLLEFALGTDPNQPGSTPVAMDFMDVSGTLYLRLTIPRNAAATDVTFTVQTTSDPADPGSWTADDTVVIEDTPALLVVRDALAGPRRFIRLMVERVVAP